MHSAFSPDIRHAKPAANAACRKAPTTPRVALLPCNLSKIRDAARRRGLPGKVFRVIWPACFTRQPYMARVAADFVWLSPLLTAINFVWIYTI